MLKFDPKCLQTFKLSITILMMYNICQFLICPNSNFGTFYILNTHLGTAQIWITVTIQIDVNLSLPHEFVFSFHKCTSMKFFGILQIMRHFLCDLSYSTLANGFVPLTLMKNYFDMLHHYYNKKVNFFSIRYQLFVIR